MYLYLLVSGIIVQAVPITELKTETMNKTIRIIGIVSMVLLLMGAIMRFFYIPDQVIITGTGIVLFLLIILPSFLIHSIKRSVKWKEKILHTAGFLFCMVFIISFCMILQRGPEIFLVIAISSGILVLGYFILLFRKRTYIIDEKIKWPFLAAYLSVVILVYLNLPFELQGADKFYKPTIAHPSYLKNQGPMIFIDQGHFNFHTINGRLRSTAQLLRRDGYRVLPYEGQFESGKLKECRILIVVNALHELNLEKWVLPTPSAFNDKEIVAVRNWVENGGSLLLVADHMPFAGAASNLAAAFGFKLHNGFAIDTAGRDDYFCRINNSLHDNIITNGNYADERTDSILTFTGHAFEIPVDATPIMVFPNGFTEWCPDTAWVFDHTLPAPITGYCQGAFKKYGKGRVVILGEAMMITAQLMGGLSWKKIGMNSPKAPYNHQLLLNIVRWLDGKPE
jgi:hypothetical protein